MALFPGAPPNPTSLALMVLVVEEAFPCMGRGGEAASNFPSLLLPQSGRERGAPASRSLKRLVTGPARAAAAEGSSLPLALLVAACW